MSSVFIQRAAYDLLHNSKRSFGKSLEDIADWLRKSAHTLRKEVDPNIDGAKLGLADAVEATKFTGNLVLLNEFAAECGCMVIKLPASATSDTTLGHVAELAKQFGELVVRLQEAVADGDVSENDMAHCQREAGDLVAATQAALQHLAALKASGAHSKARSIELAGA